jgi:hypothetical protein
MSRPQLRKEPITLGDIKEYLQTTDDFRLEVEVFRGCLTAGFTAEHGGSYRDPVTGLNRQFDVRAFYADGCRFLRMAIECKNLWENFPLVVSRIPRRSGENTHQVLLSAQGSGGPRFALHELRNGLFPRGEPVGKSTAQIGRRQNDKAFYVGDSEVYEKWAQTIASSHDLVSEAVTDYKRSRQPYKWAATTIQPALVVADKTLWVADYSDNGSPSDEPRQVDECSVYLDTTIVTPGPNFQIAYPISHLQIFTKSGFFDFLRKFANRGMIFDYLLPEIRDLQDAVKVSFGDLS